MGNKDFFIYSDRDELQTPSATEYRVERILKPKQFKQAINGESYGYNTFMTKKFKFVYSKF